MEKRKGNFLTSWLDPRPPESLGHLSAIEAAKDELQLSAISQHLSSSLTFSNHDQEHFFPNLKPVNEKFEPLRDCPISCWQSTRLGGETAVKLRERHH